VSEGQERLTKFFYEVRKLHEEHEQILGALQESQRTAAFYQDHFQRADQVMTAVKQGHAKTPRFKPDFLENERYLRTIRLLAKRAGFAQWNSKHLPIHVTQGPESIYVFVKEEIRKLISMGKWPRKWTPPGKRTIERRAQEAADVKYWPDPEEPPPLLGLGGGYYMPNPHPAYFEGEALQRLKELSEGWQNADFRRGVKRRLR